MPVSKSAPEEVLNHGIVLILTGAIVSMQKHLPLTKTVVVKKVVQLTDDIICLLSTISSFVCQEVDLAWYSLAVYTKYSTFTRSEKVEAQAVMDWVGSALVVHNQMNNVP